MYHLKDVMIVFVVFGSVLLFVKMLLDSRMRNRLIEKDMLSEDVKYLFANKPQEAAPSSLKWGFVCTGIGLAILIGQIVPDEMEEAITLSSIFILAGIGFLLYFFMARSMVKKAEQK